MSSFRIVIQLVHTVWTKASRGSDGARTRNAIPKAFSVPVECFSAPFGIHRVGFQECNEFQAVSRVCNGTTISELGIRDLAFELNDDSLVVNLVPDPMNAAFANRIFVSSDEASDPVHVIRAFSLKSDEWGQLRYNGRFVDRHTGSWWYEQSVYNIGLFAKVILDRFIKTRPNGRFAAMARLR